MTGTVSATVNNIACVVLAAGYSRRFGSDKRSAAVGGHTLLDLTLQSIPPLFATRVLVLHPGDEALAAHYRQHWQPVLAAEAQRGLGHSLAAALTQVQHCEGIVVVLADMPQVSPGTYATVVQHLHRDVLVVPFHQGQRGNPVGIGARFFPALSHAAGDSGARALFQRHPDSVISLDVDDAGILLDVDTAEALAQLRAGRDSEPSPQLPD